MFARHSGVSDVMQRYENVYKNNTGKKVSFFFKLRKGKKGLVLINHHQVQVVK